MTPEEIKESFPGAELVDDSDLPEYLPIHRLGYCAHCGRKCVWWIPGKHDIWVGGSRGGPAEPYVIHTYDETPVHKQCLRAYVDARNEPQSEVERKGAYRRRT